MQAYSNILEKLNLFTKKYYTKMLIKGLLLFVVLLAMLFFVVLGFEFVLWMNSVGRMVLLFVLILLGTYLLYRFIVIPLLFLSKVKNGISNKDASLLIGKHFPEVDDQLFNLLDLADNKNQSELLLASIEQRSEALNPVPFSRAIDYRENLKYVKYLLLPIGVFSLVWLTGNMGSFFNSYERVINYDIAYEPPAPFRFKLLSNDLDVLVDKSYTIRVSTIGDMRPDAVNIMVNGNELMMQNDNGTYSYSLSPPLSKMDFHFVSGKVESRIYTLNALKAPAILNFELLLNYPSYVKKENEILKSTGNAILPEGTNVTWKIVSENTSKVLLKEKDTVQDFLKSTENVFMFSKKIYSDYSYGITTSNENVDEYEKLDYKFTTIKDSYPSIRVEDVVDSVDLNLRYYVGESSDDYQLVNIRLVCYPEFDDENKQYVEISRPSSNFNQFYYTFPSGLDLEEDVPYSFYFEAIDNDAIHGGKSIKSQVFGTTLLNEDELRKMELQKQQSIIKNMDESVERFEEQQESLKEISQKQKEKEQLNYSDENQIKDFLRKQQNQEDLMQKFSKELRENLEKTTNNEELNSLLKERLERQELEARKNERLLEELDKIADKIDKEELAKRLEELANKQKNSKRNLEQLLELTKRYYVTEKAAQLADELKKLSKKQSLLSEQKLKEEISAQEQRELNVDFEELANELGELEKDNQDLKKPIDLEVNKKREESIKQDQQEALDAIKVNLKSDEPSDSQLKDKGAEIAKQKQKSAAQKIKEMGEELSESSAAGGGESSMAEDADMLRQILDNLITFSFKQEGLFESLEASDLDISNFSSTIRKQSELRALFEHVDDSLFSLSLRRAELSEFVNEQITDVYYNIDKSLESIAENQMYQGISYQKYVLNASNNLADFLANILDNMQQSMQSGSGSGSGEPGFQLPDIIKGQGELKEKMDGMGESEGGQPGEGEGKGEKGKEGQKGQDGEKGENGSKTGGDTGKGEGTSGRGEDGKSAGNEDGGKENGPSERELKEIYEIYKEQQLLRQELEQQLLNMINEGDRKLGEKLVKQMEDFENDLLENGVTQRTISKINNIEHEMLKLENATLKKGKKLERESNFNSEIFQNPILTKPSALENYRNEVEILNRQALPLRQNFQNRVKEYFKDND
ncbi:hypothetical protein [Maribacter sp. HTCC2170]|uniref:hypothetical protein n=1 Tax=Maribacter sp. (strain HTCC2170 / KCCM 42371) TaxID=313603 RepID=UPI00059FDB41|nr:hypothetical protein [Maribacter sp. HTCC2170]